MFVAREGDSGVFVKNMIRELYEAKSVSCFVCLYEPERVLTLSPLPCRSR